MSQDLTPRQQLLLWDLVSRGGRALQGALKPSVTPKDRTALFEAKMISVAKTKSRAIELTIDESGWNHIASAPPTLMKAEGSKYDRPILQFVLARLQAWAKANGAAYADIFAGRLDYEAGKTFGDPAFPVPTLMPIETAIRAAFFDIAGRPARNQVRLRQLRDSLPGIARHDLDSALVKMHDAKRARFSTLSNPPDIVEEGDAAISIKNVEFHTIWIDP